MHALIGWNSMLYQSAYSWQAEFQIFALELWQVWPKLKVPCDSNKCSGNELFVYSELRCMEAFVNNSIMLKLDQRASFARLWQNSNHVRK